MARCLWSRRDDLVTRPACASQVYFLRSMAVLIQAGPGGGVDIPAVKAVLHAQGLERWGPSTSTVCELVLLSTSVARGAADFAWGGPSGQVPGGVTLSAVLCVGGTVVHVSK